MAGASMNDIKARIKSVESTMQITKAMELVATSKLRRAKERVEKSRPYFEALKDAIDKVATAVELKNTPWFSDRKDAKTLFIVIAGDRGLAGGYNANVFRLTAALAKKETDVTYLPVGKKALEYYRHRKADVSENYADYTADVGVGPAMRMAKEVCLDFADGKIGKVIVVYTKFKSMISQIPVYEQLLPLKNNGDERGTYEPIVEQEADELLAKIVPDYVGGALYCAVCESLASESGARRSAMNSANKNAGEMIDSLMLKFNRARQAVITQEITEIVSGAEAL